MLTKLIQIVLLRSWKYKSQENRCRSALSGVGAIMSCLPREVAAVMNDLSRELGALHEPPSREFVAIPNHLSRELVGNAVWDQQLIHLGVRSNSLLNDLTRSSRTAHFVRLEPYSEPPSREFRAISLGSSRPCRSHPLGSCERSLPGVATISPGPCPMRLVFPTLEYS